MNNLNQKNNLNEEQIIKLKAGIELFNKKDFFEAHEFFEELWQEENEEIPRDQFLFLIRLAAAGVHLLNSNYSSLFLFDLAYKQILNGMIINYLNFDELSKELYNLVKTLEQASREDLQIVANTINLKIRLL